MGKPNPLELGQRVVAFVEEGNMHRETPRCRDSMPSRNTKVLS
jgi:hypothetical protein